MPSLGRQYEDEIDDLRDRIRLLEQERDALKATPNVATATHWRMRADAAEAELERCREALRDIATSTGNRASIIKRAAAALGADEGRGEGL